MSFPHKKTISLGLALFVFSCLGGNDTRQTPLFQPLSQEKSATPLQEGKVSQEITSASSDPTSSSPQVITMRGSILYSSAVVSVFGTITFFFVQLPSIIDYGEIYFPAILWIILRQVIALPAGAVSGWLSIRLGGQRWIRTSCLALSFGLVAHVPIFLDYILNRASYDAKKWVLIDFISLLFILLIAESILYLAQLPEVDPAQLPLKKRLFYAGILSICTCCLVIFWNISGNFYLSLGCFMHHLLFACIISMGCGWVLPYGKKVINQGIIKRWNQHAPLLLSEFLLVLLCFCSSLPYIRLVNFLRKNRSTKLSDSITSGLLYTLFFYSFFLSIRITRYILGYLENKKWSKAHSASANGKKESPRVEREKNTKKGIDPEFIAFFAQLFGLTIIWGIYLRILLKLLKSAGLIG